MKSILQAGENLHFQLSVVKAQAQRRTTYLCISPKAMVHVPLKQKGQNA